MYPTKTRNLLLELGVLIVLLAIALPQACAHGGGGGHGSGGGHGGHGVGGGGASAAGYHSSGNYHRYYGGSYGMSGSNTVPNEPAWEGFPEDLPFARLQRFIASHLHHLHLPGRRVS